MSAGHDMNATQRTARRVAALGLGVGSACLLGGALVYLAGTPDMPPAEWPEAGRWAAAKNLTLAAAAVMGAVLVSVGAVFALLGRTGVLTAVTVPRQGVQQPGLRHGQPEFESRRGERPDSPAGGAPDLDPTGAVPIRSGEPSQALAAESGDVAEPEPEVQPPEPRALASGTAARTLAVEESPLAEVPQPRDLIAAWNDYRRDGDGHFSRRGLQGVLDKRGLAAEVNGGDRVGAGGAVLIVETPSSTPQFYVLPSFNKSPRAVADWFDDTGGGALTSRTQRVTRVAHGRWIEPRTGSERRFEVIERGEVA